MHPPDHPLDCRIGTELVGFALLLGRSLLLGAELQQLPHLVHAKTQLVQTDLQLWLWLPVVALLLLFTAQHLAQPVDQRRAGKLTPGNRHPPSLQ